MQDMFTILLLFITVSTATEVCDKANSVELTNHSYNGIVYKDDEYFVDNRTGEARRCICKKEICVRKCCPFGQGYDENQRLCVDLPDKFDPQVREGSKVKLGFNITKEFHFFLTKMNCSTDKNESRMFLSDLTNDFYLRTDGKLFYRLEDSVPSDFILGPDKYCIDNFVGLDNTVQINALFCFVTEPEKPHNGMSAYCMVISCFFIVLTVAVYAFLPDLRTTVHGKVMMAYLSSVFVGFLFMATMQILILVNNITQIWCNVMTFIIYFSILAGFFWLNVMCYDLWRKFKKVNVTTHGFTSDDRDRFLRYCAYAFGVPTLMTILLVALEFSNLPPSSLLPNVRQQGCFLHANSKVIYLYMPILVLCVANLVFFTLVARRIKEIRKQTQRVKKSDTQKFTLYIKLFIVAGISWLLELASALFPQIDDFWQFTDAYNVLVGVIFFIIFVCKKKIFDQIKQRCKHLLGLSTPLPRPQTKSTTTTAMSMQPQGNSQTYSRSSTDNVEETDKKNEPNK